ncbi:hypothetical protein [Chloroflexus sp.]|uniref:hypothetical protein n=1 Tax=Chloroflexus sp. TaxID=1904827 RepID=UPI002ACD9508|nr:hypothetical protein [Chloroflexus sp.]
MTEWHYRWILRHHNTSGWLIEHRHGPYRFDCFHPEKQLVLEFQNKPLYDYILEKSRYCGEQGLRINWILSDDMFKSFFARARPNVISIIGNRRLVILDILEQSAMKFPFASYYIDVRQRILGLEAPEIPCGLYRIHKIPIPMPHREGEAARPTRFDYYQLRLERHVNKGRQGNDSETAH